MLRVAELLLHWLASLVKSRRRLEAENLVLRHQLNILCRRASRRLRLSNADRLAFVWLYRLCPSVVDAVAIIRPETVIRWHRQGFRAFWRWNFRSRGGRPVISKEIRELIRAMSRANWLWGAPRIHGELLKLGIEVAESTVAKYIGQTPQTTGSELVLIRVLEEGAAKHTLFRMRLKPKRALAFLSKRPRSLDNQIIRFPSRRTEYNSQNRQIDV
jgi:hypothetical protein